jgi:hypothetical protein
MSSDLPPRPNFEFLKKLAKERLRELQKQNPGAKLADAQHAVARQCGRQALFFSRFEASGCSASYETRRRSHRRSFASGD